MHYRLEDILLSNQISSYVNLITDVIADDLGEDIYATDDGNYNALTWSTRHDDTVLFNELIAAGLDPKIKTRLSKFTLLHLATLYKSSRLVAPIIACGVDPWATDTWEFTAFDV